MQLSDTPYMALRNRYHFLPKDFVEAGEGVLCAVVAEGTEAQRVLVTPRYVRMPSGCLRKLTTAESQALVSNNYATWLYHSPVRDIALPAIPIEELAREYRPTEQWSRLLDRRNAMSPIFEWLATTLATILPSMGVTGSHLIAADREGSDIDLVAYGLATFSRARELLFAATQAGTLPGLQLCELTRSQWFDSFERRGCGDLTFDEYLWHEQRKRNKFSISGIKVDLSCIDEPHPSARSAGHKLGQRRMRAKVIDDAYAFAYPAVLALDHPTIKTIVVYTATYIGQAQVGEQIEACGTLEAESNGALRLVVGSSREAPGEYIKVV